MNGRTPITILEVRPQKEATNAGVVQDKYPPRRIDGASDQPRSAAAPTESARREPPPSNPPADNRPKHHGSETRQTAQIAGRAPFTTKAKIQAIAKANGLSESEVVVSLVHKAIQIDGDVQYGAMLRPVIQDQIHKLDSQVFLSCHHRHVSHNLNSSVFQGRRWSKPSQLALDHVLFGTAKRKHVV